MPFHPKNIALVALLSSLPIASFSMDNPQSPKSNSDSYSSADTISPKELQPKSLSLASKNSRQDSDSQGSITPENLCAPAPKNTHKQSRQESSLKRTEQKVLAIQGFPFGKPTPLTQNQRPSTHMPAPHANAQQKHPTETIFAGQCPHCKQVSKPAPLLLYVKKWFSEHKKKCAGFEQFLDHPENDNYLNLPPLNEPELLVLERSPQQNLFYLVKP